MYIWQVHLAPDESNPIDMSESFNKEDNGNNESSHAMELAFSKFQNKKRSELISLIENLEDIQDTDRDCRKTNKVKKIELYIFLSLFQLIIQLNTINVFTRWFPNKVVTSLKVLEPRRQQLYIHTEKFNLKRSIQ